MGLLGGGAGRRLDREHRSLRNGKSGLIRKGQGARELLFLPLGVPAEGLLRDPGSRALVPTVCTGSEEEE